MSSEAVWLHKGEVRSDLEGRGLSSEQPGRNLPNVTKFLMFSEKSGIWGMLEIP